MGEGGLGRAAGRGAELPRKTLAPRQPRKFHCVVSSRWPPAPPEKEIPAGPVHTGGGGAEGECVCWRGGSFLFISFQGAK